MTNSNSDRLNVIEALLSETTLLTRSNARAIQSLTDALVELKLIVAEDRERAAEERAELRRATIGIAPISATHPPS